MDPNDRDYSNAEITVHWRPSKCIHATTCYRELLEVFNPRRRPWVNMEGAPVEKIIEIVKKCPTQALTYDWNDPDMASEKPGKTGITEPEVEKDKPVSIKMMKDGPYVVEGVFRITGPDGKTFDSLRMTSFCRCGKSYDMPFCDGSHRKNNFSHDCE
jgi:uncharacterized Fe-S cluster protein YjdI